MSLLLSGLQYTDNTIKRAIPNSHLQDIYSKHIISDMQNWIYCISYTGITMQYHVICMTIRYGDTFNS